MLFPSFPFILVFLPVVLAGTYWLARTSTPAAVAWLGAASLAFYAVWSVPFTALLLASVAFNFLAGGHIARSRERPGGRWRLGLAIGANLAVLGYFKYANFFLSTIGVGGIANVVLPLGISFYTFTQIAFLVDVHRGASEYRFGRYLLFVTYFPHLVAGPLLHHGKVVPQFERPGAFRFDPTHVAVGLSIFTLGLAKKVLIADPMAQFSTPVFDLATAGASPRLFEAWMGALGYTLQLYFDFSGYSDMAIGLSMMLGVRLPLNFDSPYKATSIVEFWRRWHMTLSAFLRDYLYFPLGGNRKGIARRYVNLMVTMVLGGLWHGAGWTFLAWGALHGAYLVVNHAWRGLAARARWACDGPAWRAAAFALTFLAVVAGWVVFRADTLGAAGAILSGMAGLNGLSLPPDVPATWHAWAQSRPPGTVIFEGLAPLTFTDGRVAIAAIGAGLAVVWLAPNVRQIFSRFDPVSDAAPPAGEALPVRARWNAGPLAAVTLGGLLCICLLWMGTARTSEFLYFQF